MLFIAAGAALARATDKSRGKAVGLCSDGWRDHHLVNHLKISQGRYLLDTPYHKMWGHALGASFLSAVADRFGYWGPYGAKNVSWGDFPHFVKYTSAVTCLFPSTLAVPFAWTATVAETLLGILLIIGFRIRMVSVLSGLLLLSFAIAMLTGLGIKPPFDYSIFSAAAAAFLLAFWEPDRLRLDKLLI